MKNLDGVDCELFWDLQYEFPNKTVNTPRYFSQDFRQFLQFKRNDIGNIELELHKIQVKEGSGRI